MSQTGLYAGIYEGLREYAELVDKVLIQLKSGTGPTDIDKLNRLREFLERISSNTSEDISTRLIRLLLRDECDVQLAEFARIGRALSSGTSDSSVIEPLEKLALALEHEQAGVMARMRE